MATAFVLMPFDSVFDWLYLEIVGAGEDSGVQVSRADDIFEAGVIIEQIKDRIKNADAVIAVCTGRNANVFYELGIADALHRPILIAQKAADLPFDVQHFRAQFYGGTTDSDSLKTVRQRVAAALRETIPVQRRSPARLQEQSRAHLTAGVTKGGQHDYVFRITNDGDIPLYDVDWVLPAQMSNWEILTSTLARYPIRVLEPGERATALLSVVMGGVTAGEILLRGKLQDGQFYQREQAVSIIGA